MFKEHAGGSTSNSRKAAELRGLTVLRTGSAAALPEGHRQSSKPPSPGEGSSSSPLLQYEQCGGTGAKWSEKKKLLLPEDAHGGTAGGGTALGLPLSLRDHQAAPHRAITAPGVGKATALCCSRRAHRAQLQPSEPRGRSARRHGGNDPCGPAVPTQPRCPQRRSVPQPGGQYHPGSSTAAGGAARRRPRAGGEGAEARRGAERPRGGPAEARAEGRAGLGQPSGRRSGGGRPGRARLRLPTAGPYLLPARSGRRGRSGPAGPAPASAPTSSRPRGRVPRPSPRRPVPQRPPGLAGLRPAPRPALLPLRGAARPGVGVRGGRGRSCAPSRAAAEQRVRGACRLRRAARAPRWGKTTRSPAARASRGVCAAQRSGTAGPWLLFLLGQKKPSCPKGTAPRCTASRLRAVWHRFERLATLLHGNQSDHSLARQQQGAGLWKLCRACTSSELAARLLCGWHSAELLQSSAAQGLGALTAGTALVHALLQLKNGHELLPGGCTQGHCVCSVRVEGAGHCAVLLGSSQWDL